MTAYEITQDLLRSTTAAAPPATRTRTFGRIRGLVTAGLAAGALILAAPATSTAAAAAPPHSAIAESNASSTPPSTITLTTRRTGSVIL
ncbi:hypothetical protein SAMN04515671_2599 [Nakamurella panacisegetis]|uniref:Uncharacterized protein n=1 Tax=Nakamurella panacisegetis TaxID=1090615 RepID=A0A1H0P301_9ACTN|nr:hypothetical protein [Nakamurella panacisegetis]SDO99392.1 hypothetical protein SAMN04515671_2599 [Nakamurella panacisegetis]